MKDSRAFPERASGVTRRDLNRGKLSGAEVHRAARGVTGKPVSFGIPDAFMGKARTGVLRADARPWEWEDVRATTDRDGVHLAHIGERAELLLRDGRLIPGAGYSTASSTARRSLARVGAILRLRARGRYLVHAGAVVDPSGGAWLLAGDSGSAKSTLARALVTQGWSLLADDGVLIADGDGGVMACAWRACGPVEEEIVRQAPMRRIVFLARSERDRVLRVGPAVALASLVRQSPWVLIDDEDAPRHLTLLAAVAESVPAYHLAHTEGQLEELPRTLAALS